MREKRFRLRAVVLTAIIAVAATLAAVALAAWLLLGQGGIAMLEGAFLVKTRFVGEYTQKEMSDGALDGMVRGLGDRWTYYLTAEEYAAQNERRLNQYTGVGFTYLVEEDRYLSVQSVTPGSPAEEAGLLAGDLITAVDGVELTAENFYDRVALFQGEPGDRVAVLVRGTDGSTRTLELVVGVVKTDPVTVEMLEDRIGYLRLENFYSRSAQRVREGTEELITQGAEAILFDVRGNPGGYVSELTKILDYLLPEGPIFTERTKYGPVKTVNSDEACVDLPMAVLVDRNSYSAAELFAAQLRESAGAPIVGQVTSGKGYYQQALELVNGGALNLSTGVYGTGAGESLIGKGLTPDKTADDPEEQAALGLRLLREKMEEGEHRG